MAQPNSNSEPVRHFRFMEFPIEIATCILAFSAVSPFWRWRTYQSLIVVSRGIQALVYDACLPYLPVMLHTRSHVESFCTLLESNPVTVGPRIRTLWLIAGIKADVERALGDRILQKCTRITHIACNINLLKALLCRPAAFVHRDLKELTLIEPIIPWGLLLGYSAGRQFFAQLTHLRSNGGTKFTIPSDFCFSSLTHLSFSCHQLPFGSSSVSPFDSTRFPVLQQIVPSFPYMVCRLWDPITLGTAGDAIDPRINIIACPKKWKEADVWKNAMHGGKDLWARACSTEFLQKSHAFTETPPGPRWDYDDDDDFERGETGL